MLKLLQSRHVAGAVVVGLLGAMCLALISRGLLGHTPHYDELLHVLAARGLLDSGAPAIAEGVYPRALAFTRSVAWFFELFGESLVVARLPALLAGAALVFVLGAWLTWRVGLLAGATAAILLCAAPSSVTMAVFARFYTPHALLVLVMLIALFEGTRPGRGWTARAVLCVVGVLAMLGAWHFQSTTVIAVGAGLGAAFFVLVHDRWEELNPIFWRHPVLIGAALIVVSGVLLFVLMRIGLLERLGETALWAERRAGRYQYYLTALRNDLPLLWPMLPVAAVVAWLHGKQRRLIIFTVVFAALALFTHSIAAQKETRYIYYVIPWLCVIWGCAAAAVLDLGSRGDADAGRRPSPSAPWVVAGLLGVVFILSAEGTRMLNLAAGRFAAVDDLPFLNEPNWAPATAVLLPQAEVAARIVASNSMKAVYYLGNYDLELNATIVPETNEQQDFGVDPRTGRRVISRPDSVLQVLEQEGSTLVVLEKPKVGSSSGVPLESFRIIEDHCSEIELPSETQVRAWTCTSVR